MRAFLARAVVATIWLLAGGVGYAIATGSQSSPPTPDFPVAIYLLGGALAGGLVPLIGSSYISWRRRASGKLGVDDELVSRILGQTIAGAKGMLEEYRIETEVAKRQISEYREQFNELNRQLGAANARITRLEQDLKGAISERDEVREQLRIANTDREVLTAQMLELRNRITELESVPGLEGD